MAADDLTRVLDELEWATTFSPTCTPSARPRKPKRWASRRDVAKTLIVKTGDGYVRVVLQGSGRLDLRKLRALLDGNKHDVRLASEEDLGRDFPEFELGAVPRIGGGRGDPVVVDSRVAEREALVLEAGSHEESVRLATDDLIRLAHAQVADVSES
jgi:Ala-tRNA(Pro) deacylase